MKKKQKLKKQLKQYFYFWVSSMVVFYLSILFAGGNFATSAGFLVLVCLLSVLAGIVFFCLLLVSIIKNKDWKMS